MRQYRFEEGVATSSTGGKVAIPAGIHTVERHSLLLRLQLGGREVDLTLAEFDRMARDGKVHEVADPPSGGT